jgi:hypothetical protein
MKHLVPCFLALVIASVYQNYPTSAAELPGGPPFMNNDLSNWQGLIADHWTYKDGALVGVAPQGLKFNTFLCSKQKYSDFELKFQVWLIGENANSGVQIRSEIFDPKHFAVRGPQCDMGQVYWASLYGEHFGGAKDKNGLAAGGMMKQAPADLVKRVLKEGGFNDYSIKCVGKHVTIKLNGQTTVDDDFPSMPSDGIIAWQIHAGPPMVVIFRNIDFVDLRKNH